MFLAGLLSVVASFAGYVQSGGGEELLRRALAGFTKHRAQFDSLSFEWKAGEMVVKNLQHEPFEWPEKNPIAKFSGLLAREMTVKLDLFPWPPAVESITVRGMPKTAIVVSEGFLQTGKLQELRLKNVPTVRFENCDLDLTIGQAEPPVATLKLSGCRGELRRGAWFKFSDDSLVFLRAAGVPEPVLSKLNALKNKEFETELQLSQELTKLLDKNELERFQSHVLNHARRGSAKEPPRGSFSLRELNGKPFNLKLETLEDRRWVFTGEGIQIDTRAIEAKRNPFVGQLDPVGLLVSALFTGDMGAEGTISSLRLTVQPATGARKFVCDGEVGYRNLQFHLPKPAAETGQALPFMLNLLLGAGENLWPRWMQVDVVRTGADGRVAFHMADGRLNFACDEGPGSAFTGIRGGQSFPPLEALKGAVETDENNLARSIVLRGFLGQELSFETHVEKNPDRSRTYEMLLGPRAPLPQAGGEYKPAGPLWRFASRLTDYVDVKPGDRPAVAQEHSLVSFAVGAEGRHFPWPDWLPPGMRDLSGRISAEGRFTDQKRLRVDKISLDDGAVLIYGGAAGVRSTAGPAPVYGPLGDALQELFGTAAPWELRDLTLRGRADVELTPDLFWQRTVLDDFALLSGSLVYKGRLTNLAPTGILLKALHTLESEMSDIGVQAYVPDKWKVRLTGAWRPDGSTGTFKLLEEGVPYDLHPQQDVLPPGQPVSRETTVRIEKGKPPAREVMPVAPSK